jgi:hypothetical protein
MDDQSENKAINTHQITLSYQKYKQIAEIPWYKQKDNITNVEVTLTTQDPVRNKDGDHVVLYLCREEVGRICHSNRQGRL